MEVAEDRAAVLALAAAPGLVPAAVAAAGPVPTAAADHDLAQSLVPSPAADPGLVAVAPANQKADPLHPTASPTVAQTGKMMIRCTTGL